MHNIIKLYAPMIDVSLTGHLAFLLHYWDIIPSQFHIIFVNFLK